LCRAIKAQRAWSTTPAFSCHNNHYTSLVSAESRQHNSEWWGGVVGKDGDGEACSRVKGPLIMVWVPLARIG
jgi:hypothetical protein